MINIERNPLLKKFFEFTEEERSILSGGQIDKNIYSKQIKNEFVIDGTNFMNNNSIYIRKHPRFCRFPKHKHNFVELNFVLNGKMRQIIDGEELTVNQGEIAFLNQHIEHEILEATEEDIIINFIMLPNFYDFVFKFLDDQNIVTKFFISTLKESTTGQYLLFKVSKVVSIQNLLENLLINLISSDNAKNDITKQTFMLLLFELTNHIDKLQKNNVASYETSLILETLKYIEENYRDGNLYDLCDYLNQDYYTLSKFIKNNINSNFKELIQNKKLSVASELLTTTKLTVDSIANYVGYSNLSFFYRIFKNRYGVTPSKYRKK